MTTQQWYSVDQVADLLGLHVRTVRGYVRQGLLDAVRVGKQYRVSREALEAFTGGRPEPVARTRHVEVSSVVQIDAISHESMTRLTTMVTSSLNGPSEDEPLRVETVYDEQRASLKLIVIGGTGRTAELLALIGSIAEQV